MFNRITNLYTNFRRNRVCRSVKTVHTICQNIVSCINLQIAIIIFQNNDFLTCTTPADVQTEFEINRPIKIKITVTMKYVPQATDGRTDGQIGVFLSKR